MNIFRFVADLLHLASFLVLIHRIRNKRNCLGISYKSQEIYLVVFLTRYWDLFLYFVSPYNTIMKVLYISLTVYIIYLMKVQKPFCLTYDPNLDGFPHYKFIYPIALVLALVIHTEFTAFEISWSYSIWLEAIAIIPQVHMMQKHKEVENITGQYMAALGFYRGFYVFNWVYRYFVEGSLTWTSILGGVVQTAIYSDFLYIYIKARGQGKAFQIPV